MGWAGTRFGIAIVIALIGGALTAGCQAPQAARIELGPDETLRISRAVWEKYIEYSNLMVSAGAFVVSETGMGAGFSLCPGLRCRPQNYVRQAIHQCEEAGVKCVLFADGLKILVDFEIVD